MDIFNVTITTTEDVIPLCDQFCFTIEFVDSNCSFNSDIADLEIEFHTTVFDFTGGFPTTTSSSGLFKTIHITDLPYNDPGLNTLDICLDVALLVSPTSDDDIFFRIKHDQESTMDEQVTLTPTSGSNNIFNYINSQPLDIDLSAALANPAYNLVSALNSCGYGSQNPIPQTILIDGEIEFDTDYCFDNSIGTLDHTIAFLPGAKITITNNSTIEIDNYTLRGCERIWKSITVDPGSELIIKNSIIQDAENAIDANSTSRIICIWNTFQNNINDILCDDPGAIATTSQFYSNNFIGGQLKPFYESQELFLDRSHISVIAKNQSFLSVSGILTVSGFLRNSWENYNIAVLAENSNMQLNYNQFSNIGNLPPQNILQDINEFGAVYATTTGKHYLEMINPNPGTGGITDVRRGVYAEKYDVLFKNQLIDRALVGLQFKDSYYRTIDVLDNTIKASRNCIISDGAQNFYGTIRDNAFTIDGDPLSSEAIKITETENFYFLSWRIQNNTINILDAHKGISISGNQRIKISDNDIYFLSEQIQPKFGISNQGVQRINASCNFITSYHNNDVNAEDVGIFYENAENSPVNCNFVDRTRINMKFKGTTNSIDLAANQFGDNRFGLVLGDETTGGIENAIIGLQPHKGNLWVGTSSVQNAKNSSDIVNKALSEVRVFFNNTDGLGDPYPANLWPWAPTQNLDPQWTERVLSQTPYELCATCDGNIGANGLIGGERGDPEYLNLLGERSGFVGMSAMVYDRLLNEQSLEDLILINEIDINTYKELSAVEPGVLNEFWDALLLTDLSMVEEWDNSASLALADDITSEYENLTTTVSKDLAADLLDQLENLTTDVAKESVQYGYLKSVLQFYIYGEELANNGSYISELKSLAATCNREGGQYVFLCRNLLHRLIQQTVDVEECISQGDESEPRGRLVEEFLVFPNPASEVLSLDGIDGFIKRVTIQNSLGEPVIKALGTDNTIIISKLSPGIYSIMVETERQIFTSKFVKI